MSSGCSNTRKIIQNFESLSHPKDKKPTCRILILKLGMSDSSFEGAKFIRLAPIVNRLFASSGSVARKPV